MIHAQGEASYPDCRQTVADEEDEGQWAVEFRSDVNPRQIAKNYGFEYEGPVSQSLPHVHLLRLFPDKDKFPGRKPNKVQVCPNLLYHI